MNHSKEANKNIFYFLVFLFSSIFILSGCVKTNYFGSANSNSGIEVAGQPQGGQVAIIESDIIVTSPLSNDVISSPIEITGRSGFSGSVFFRLKDAWDQVIASSSAATLAGGSYSDVMDFKAPSTSFGSLEVYLKRSDNGSEYNLIKIPVVFEYYVKPVVKVYFSNINRDPNLIDCSKVYPVDREVEFTKQLPLAAVDELLKGLTEQEMKAGFISSISENGIVVQKLEIKDGTAYVDFNQALQAGVGGSCRVIAIRSQITETLKQFNEVEDAVISIDGKTEDILQP